MNNYFNPYGPIPNQTRAIPPISIPKSSMVRKSFLPTLSKGMSFNKLLKTTEQGINTFNQIIPIYQQIKPLVSNTKDATKILKRAFIKPKAKTVTAKATYTKVKPNITKEETLNKKETAITEPIKEQNHPSAPFFNVM